MYKNFNLTDEERKQIMEMHQSHGYKKPVNEDMMGGEESPEQPQEETPAAKVEDVVNSNPHFNNSIDAIVSALSDDEIAELQSVLSSNGITASSSAEDVHSALSQPQEDETQQEMGEDHNPKKEIRSKVANILHGIGAGNIAAWGGVPAAIAIGSMTGMPLGFAISWGATAVLMGIAKKLNPSVDKETLSEGLGDEAYEFMAAAKRISNSLEMLQQYAKQGNMRAANEEKEVLVKYVRRAEYSLDSIKRMLR